MVVRIKKKTPFISQSWARIYYSISLLKLDMKQNLKTPYPLTKTHNPMQAVTASSI